MSSNNNRWVFIASDRLLGYVKISEYMKYHGIMMGINVVNEDMKGIWANGLKLWSESKDNITL